MKQKNDIIKNVLNIKQVQIENSSSINAIKLRQDIKKMQHQVLFSRTLKKKFPPILILMLTHQRKKFQ